MMCLGPFADDDDGKTQLLGSRTHGLIQEEPPNAQQKITGTVRTTGTSARPAPGWTKEQDSWEKQ